MLGLSFFMSRLKPNKATTMIVKITVLIFIFINYSTMIQQIFELTKFISNYFRLFFSVYILRTKNK